MKSKLYFISVITAVLLFTAGNRTADAQVSLGAGALYGAEEDGFGLNLNGLYHLRDNVAVTTGAIWWPRSAPDDARYLLTELNAELRYIPYSTGGFSSHVSAITGYHYFGVRIESLGDIYKSSEHMTAIGGGAGITYNLGTVSLTTGVRHFLTGFNQLSAGVGVQVGI